MRGQPKFKEEDYVKFSFDGEEKVGKIVVVDRHGTFFDRSGVSYDIMSEPENMLYKHIPERVVGKSKKK